MPSNNGFFYEAFLELCKCKSTVITRFIYFPISILTYNKHKVNYALSSHGGSVVKESLCQCRRHEFDCWVRKIPWRRKWLPTPASLLGKSHGQRSLVGYSPWGRKESDMT